MFQMEHFTPNDRQNHKNSYKYNLSNMYMKKDILTVSALFLVIIFLAIWFSTTPAYVPYSSTIFSKQAKFEGFSTRMAQEYSSASDNSAIDSPVSGYLIQPVSAGPKAVAGFRRNGVFNTPDVAISEKLDIYSEAKGDLNAEGYGYYNSMGSLVLDDKMKSLLMTRGMNASGSPSQIGGAAV
jgi:hypothetical protein